MSEPIWDSTIAEQERDLVCGLGTQCDEIPKHVHILVDHVTMVQWSRDEHVTNLEVCLRVSFLSMDETGKLKKEKKRKREKKGTKR